MLINESNYVDKADQAIRMLVKKEQEKNPRGKANIVTTSKLRNLLAMTADIYNQILNVSADTLDPDVCGRIEYLRVRFIYECGREPKVKALVDEAEILKILKEIGKSRANYILFSRYMEALVAFHRFYGGKDQ
ncbi:MAG TPA: type III-A CRISPR-associated protein Csm2 [Candidatus Caccomorpha excrementavium]|nr:type III-A CRISPR-associated protein Csm2 [Candidatus Caccomorpha excrementavium]